MKKNLILFAISSAVCLAVAKVVSMFLFAPIEQQDNGPAEIRVEQKTAVVTYDSEEQVAFAEYMIHNLGSRRLVVDVKESNCDCYLHGGSLSVAPGQSGKLTLPLSMRALEGRERVELLIVTNDPSQKRIVVSVEVHDSMPAIPPAAVSVLQASLN